MSSKSAKGISVRRGAGATGKEATIFPLRRSVAEWIRLNGDQHCHYFSYLIFFFFLPIVHYEERKSVLQTHIQKWAIYIKKKRILYTNFCSKYTIYFENFGKYTMYFCLKKYIQYIFRIYFKKLLTITVNANCVFYFVLSI